MMIKICGIRTAADAQAAADADAIGFNFYPRSPRYLMPSAAGAIPTPPHVRRVGVFVDATVPQLLAAMAEARLDIVQLHGAWPAEEIPASINVWRAVSVARQADVDGAEPRAAALLLDTPAPGVHGGTGHTFDWTLARAAGRPVILAGGLDAGNVQNAIRAAAPWGVDACSRLERAPGEKDWERVRRFIAAAREELS